MLFSKNIQFRTACHLHYNKTFKQLLWKKNTFCFIFYNQGVLINTLYVMLQDHKHYDRQHKNVLFQWLKYTLYLRYMAVNEIAFAESKFHSRTAPVTFQSQSKWKCIKFFWMWMLWYYRCTLPFNVKQLWHKGWGFSLGNFTQVS